MNCRVIQIQKVTLKKIVLKAKESLFSLTCVTMKKSLNLSEFFFSLNTVAVMSVPHTLKNYNAVDNEVEAVEVA